MKFLLIFFTFWWFQPVALAANNHIEAKTSLTDKPSACIQIHYTVKTGIGSGELNETIRIEEKNTFNITSQAQATGIFKITNPGKILRTSRGSITENGLRPDYYSDDRSNDKSSLALFNWENHTLTLKHKNLETQQPLTVHTLDRLSLSYNFVLTDTDSLQQGKQLDIRVTDGRSLQLMRFEVGTATLDTPLGQLDTVVLTKQYDQNDTVQRRIWLAPDYHMMPVHIQSVEEDGLEVEKMVADIDFDCAADNNTASAH